MHAGWLDNSLFLGVLWAIFGVPAVLLPSQAFISWHQVGMANFDIFLLQLL